MTSTRNNYKTKVFLSLLSLAFLQYASSAPVFGDRIVPLKRQIIQASVQHSHRVQSPFPAGFIPSPVRYERSFLQAREDTGRPIKRAGNRRNSNIQNRRKPWLPTRQSMRRKDTVEKIEIADDAAFFVPVLAAPAPVQRHRTPKAPVYAKPVQRKPKKASRQFSPEIFGSENREALTIVPAPDLTRERDGRALYQSANTPAISLPSRVSNDNFFSAENGESSRRAVAGQQSQSGAVKGSDEDDFFFDDEDEADDEPSWVKPIFGRNGRAIERSSFFGLDENTKRYFSKPSDYEDEDYTLSDAVDVKPSSYTPSGVPVYVSSSNNHPVYPKSESYETKRYKQSELPAYARPQPITVATVFSPSHIRSKLQGQRPLPLEEQSKAYYNDYKEPEYSYESSHEPAYAPHDEPLSAGGYDDYRAQQYQAEPAYQEPLKADYGSSAHAYPEVSLDGPAPHAFPAVIGDDYHAPNYDHNEVAYGAETGNHGAFSYYVDIPVGCSGQYGC